MCVSEGERERPKDIERGIIYLSVSVIIRKSQAWLAFTYTSGNFERKTILLFFTASPLLHSQLLLL